MSYGYEKNWLEGRTRLVTLQIFQKILIIFKQWWKLHINVIVTQKNTS